MNFRSSGWVNHKPQKHTDDIEYEPDHDHTKNDDYGMYTESKCCDGKNYCYQVLHFSKTNTMK